MTSHRHRKGYKLPVWMMRHNFADLVEKQYVYMHQDVCLAYCTASTWSFVADLQLPLGFDWLMTLQLSFDSYRSFGSASDKTENSSSITCLADNVSCTCLWQGSYADRPTGVRRSRGSGLQPTSASLPPSGELILSRRSRVSSILSY